MSQLINVPLESYLLAQQSEPIDCLVCDQENSSSADRCCRCSTPIALSRQAAETKQTTHLIAVIGAAGAGKTVYLGMLTDMLVRGVGSLRGTLRGAVSIRLQQTATTALASGCYPDKTRLEPEHWHWVHGRIDCGRRRRPTDVILADIAGEAWASEADKPGRHPAIPALLSKASAIVVVADAQRLHAGDHADDFVVLKLLSMLSEMKPPGGGRFRKAPDRPLALVLTKGDACQSCLDNPESFAEAHAEGMLRDCQARFPKTKVFGASAVGASAVREMRDIRRQVPLRIEPQGIIEPMGWLLSEL